jgi:hypothetical protein
MNFLISRDFQCRPKMTPNPAAKLAPFARWTLRDSAPRSVAYLERRA